ncbi:MAG: hypothetical protein AB7E52_05225 [Bdellovibrionales bacterium]
MASPNIPTDISQLDLDLKIAKNYPWAMPVMSLLTSLLSGEILLHSGVDGLKSYGLSVATGLVTTLFFQRASKNACERTINLRIQQSLKKDNNHILFWNAPLDQSSRTNNSIFLTTLAGFVHSAASLPFLATAQHLIFNSPTSPSFVQNATQAFTLGTSLVVTLLSSHYMASRANMPFNEYFSPVNRETFVQDQAAKPKLPQTAKAFRLIKGLLKNPGR